MDKNSSNILCLLIFPRQIIYFIINPIHESLSNRQCIFVDFLFCIYLKQSSQKQHINNNININIKEMQNVKILHQNLYYTIKFNQIMMQSGGHGSGHGSGQMQGHVHHAGCSHGQQHQVQPQQYFKQLKQLKQKNRQFYWMQVIKGAVLAKYLENYGLGFLNSINAHIIQGVIGMVHMMLTFDWLPLFLRPFVSGMFWIILLFIFANYKIITGFSNEDINTNNDLENLDRSANTIIFSMPIVLYVLIGLRTSGKVKTNANTKIAQKIIQARPYLESPSFSCRGCNMPKAFRACHCPLCKTCVPKFSRHSLVFGVCVGAANELLVILFFLSMAILSSYSLYKLVTLRSLYGIITLAMIYSINLAIIWMSVVQFFTFIILNLNFGITEFQVQNWMMLQYLMKAPMRQFSNGCNTGFMHNVAEDLFALFGISGFQAQLYNSNRQIQQKQNQPLNQQVSHQNKNLGFPEVKDGIKYIVNWDKAYITVIPQMPNNPRRKQILQLMMTQEPRMINNFKMLKTFKQQIEKEHPQLNQFQVQQRAMMKMNEHMMKNPQAASALRPPPQQQKAIQLQMLGHMKLQFKNDEQIYKSFEEIQDGLKSGKIGPQQATMKMRMTQQKVMQKKMKQIMQAQKQQQQQGQQTQGGSSQSGQTQNQAGASAMNLQSLIQAQMMQKLDERNKINEMEKQKMDKKTQKQQQSDKLKSNEELIQDDNL